MKALTSTVPTGLLKRPHAQPIPGYTLIEPLGRGGFGEVWKCEAPGGLFKAIKFVDGNKAHPAAGKGMQQELEALHRIKAIRHPFLLSMDRIEVIGGELVLVMELADASLLDLLRQCQARGQAGLPRDDLLGYLWEAAEVLDLMNLHHQLQHLDIKPANLFLISNHVKVADFGLVNSLQEVRAGASPSGQPTSISPLYAPPERFLGGASSSSDQYSLAVTYHELLTGKYPFTGKTYLQLLLKHTKREPDLCLLPATDRPAVARALAKDPAHRFPSCTDFLRALVAEETRRFAARPTGAVAEPFRPSGHGGGSPSLEETPVASLAGATDSNHLAAATSLVPPTGSAEEVILLQVAGRNNQEPCPTLSPNDEFLSRCRFLSALGKSALAESWLVQTPDNAKRLVKLLYGFASLESEGEWEALLQLIGLRHEGLARLEVLRSDPTRLWLASGPFEQTLYECLEECKAQRRPGIPQQELLGYVGEAAQTLDALFAANEYPHLGLTPHNLVLTKNALLVADYGLVPFLFLPADEPLEPFTARYAAPELGDRQMGAACDQYSLALIYLEMRTGRHPFADLSERRLNRARRKRELDLSALPIAEQQILTRALAPRPQDRFPTCTALVRALEAAAGGAVEGRTQPRAATSGRDRRMQERLPFDQPVTIFAALPNDTVGEAMQGRGKDISLNGLGLRVPRKPPTAQVHVWLKAPGQSAPQMALARVMRAHSLPEGGHELGLLFLTPLDEAFLASLLEP